MQQKAVYIALMLLVLVAMSANAQETTPSPPHSDPFCPYPVNSWT